MIGGIHKFYPFLFPDPVDLKKLAHDRRAERLNEEYKLALIDRKITNKVYDLEMELYGKRAAQNKIRLEIFSNRKVDFFA